MAVTPLCAASLCSATLLSVVTNEGCQLSSALPCLALQLSHLCNTYNTVVQQLHCWPRMASFDTFISFSYLLALHGSTFAFVQLCCLAGNCTSRSSIVVSALLLVIHVQCLVYREPAWQAIAAMATRQQLQSHLPLLPRNAKI